MGTDAGSHSSAALLTLVEGVKGGVKRAFKVFDYIVDYIDTKGEEIDPSARTVPDTTWDIVVNRSSSEDALFIGMTSYSRGQSSSHGASLEEGSDSSAPSGGPGGDGPGAAPR